MRTELGGEVNIWRTPPWAGGSKSIVEEIAQVTAHQTPLHYDDEDNILWVLSGTKDIVLIPPSMSSHLHPTVYSEAITPHAVDRGVVVDVGIRAYGTP